MTETTNPDTLRTEADDDLLIRYRDADDSAALAELDRRYHQELLLYARRHLPAALRADAEDMVQKALLSLHKNRKRYRPQGGIQKLLYMIVARRCRDHLDMTGNGKRDYRRTVHLDANRDKGVAGDVSGCNALLDPRTDPSRQQMRIKVDEALDTLPPEQAEAIRLTRIDGHTAESAAELLGISPWAVHKRAERGIDTLKKLAATTLILFALVGAVADNCDLDVCMNLVAAEADEDEVVREGGGGHHESNKLCRKSLMRLPKPETNMTNMTEVVNARNESYDVLIARPSKWGNPFQIGRDGSRERVIRMYEVHLRHRPDLMAALPELAGKRLGCYCKPEACHGDVLVKLLRELFLEV